MNPNIASLASALHEIRTPIQTILGTAELLKSTELDPEQQEYVRQIAFSADVIHTLANDILDFEKLRTGNLNLERIEFDLVDTIEQVLNLVSIEAHNKGIELLSSVDNQIPYKICGDPLRLQQILLNMVKNAVKFTPSGYIEVKVRRETGCTPEEKAMPDEATNAQNTTGDRLVFTITDSGVGVPADKKESIFQAFTQASTTTTRQYGGTGLGLNICTQLVTLMKGSLGVQDNPEGGSVFYFSVPLDYLPHREPRAAVPKLQFPPDSRILVVDDNSRYRQSLSSIIAATSNLQTTNASSGEEALDLMRAAAERREEFALVLMDMGMPAMDGWRLAAEINNDPLINGAKLYLMIPEGQLGGEAKMKLLSWFNGYLYKPLQRQKLQELLIHAFAQPLELPAVEKTEAARNAHEGSAASEQAAPCGSPQENFFGTVIAVDDHPVNLKILTTFLTSLGAEAYGAESGAEAIELAKLHPDTKIIFMDIEMPFMNGFETSKKIRDGGFEGIIVACSANSTPDIVQDYVNAGFNDYFAKPFKKQQLADVLEKWKSLPATGVSGLWGSTK